MKSDKDFLEYKEIHNSEYDIFGFWHFRNIFSNNKG